MKKLFLIVFLILVLNSYLFSQDYFNKNIVLHLIEGETIKLDNYKGKIIVINIWSTHCKPCIEEIPLLNKLVDKYGDSIVFLAITPEKGEKIKPFLENHQFKYNQIIEGSEFINLNQNKFITSFPVSFILDQKGKLRYKKRGSSANIDDLLVKEIEKLKSDL